MKLIKVYFTKEYDLDDIIPKFKFELDWGILEDHFISYLLSDSHEESLKKQKRNERRYSWLFFRITIFRRQLEIDVRYKKVGLKLYGRAISRPKRRRKYKRNIK